MLYKLYKELKKEGKKKRKNVKIKLKLKNFILFELYVNNKFISSNYIPEKKYFNDFIKYYKDRI